ncbi:CpXC domain-containing protein, partial [Verrucomicrobiota bacterium]
RIECEECDFSFRADMPVLYTDLEKGIIIHWIPLHNQPLEQLQQEFGESQEEMRRELPDGTPVPRLQLVLTRVELIERIFLLEQDLDERLIEYVKYLIYQNNASRVPAQDKNLLFNAQKSDDNNFCFVVQDINTASFDEILSYPRSQYQKLKNKFMADDDELTAFFPGAYKNARLALLEQQRT